MSIHKVIENGLSGFGGLLRCTVCGHEQQLGDIGAKLAGGWPKCCGYTMRWWTARQLVEGEGNSNEPNRRHR